MLKAMDAINEEHVFTVDRSVFETHSKKIMARSGLCHVFNAKQVWEIHGALNLVNPLGRGIRNRNLASHALVLP